MTKTFAAAMLAAGLLLGYAGSAWTQTGQNLPVPGIGGARPVANAHELPDPKTDYKVVFDIGTGGKDGAVNPMLEAMARYLNTLAANGVPAEHRHIAAVFHQGGTSAVMSNDAFKARFEGKDNPNVALIHQLKQAGVDFRVCGQALLANKIEHNMVNPDIQIDLWALTTIVNLQLRGFVKVG